MIHGVMPSDQGLQRVLMLSHQVLLRLLDLLQFCLGLIFLYSVTPIL